jgi:hypothetical protein
LLHIAKSPIAAAASCEVMINGSGFKDTGIEGSTTTAREGTVFASSRIAARTSFVNDLAIGQKDGQHTAVLQQQYFG